MKKFLSIVLAVIFVACAAAPITVSASTTTGRSEIITLDEYLGATDIVKYLSAHPEDFVNSAYTSVRQHFSEPWLCTRNIGDYPKNSGMNCTGFIARVMQKCGGNLSLVPKTGAGHYANAGNWRRMIESNGIYYRRYSSPSELLKSGKLKKGDVVFFIPGDDSHLGIFWGNTPSENVFWHSTGYGNKISTMFSMTSYSELYHIPIRSSFDSNVVMGINAPRGADDLVIYNNSGSRTGTNANGVEAAVNSAGMITSLENGVGNTLVPQGGFVISGNGRARDWILNNLKVGRYVSTSYSLGGKMAVTKYADGEIRGINCMRNADSIVVYKNCSSTGTNPYGTEVRVDSNGMIKSIEIGKGNAAVPSGGFVISGNGKGAEWLRNSLKVGEKITSKIAVGEAITSHLFIDGEICGVDIPRYSDSIVIYKSKKTTGTNQYGVEAAVDKFGFVTNIYNYKGNAAVPSGGFVISGNGKGAEWIKKNIKVGSKITCKAAETVRITSVIFSPGKIWGIDTPRYPDSIVIYKSRKTTGTNQYGTEAAVDSSGIVTAVYSNKGNAAVPNGGFVISGNGKGAEWIKKNIKVGAKITSTVSAGKAITFHCFTEGEVWGIDCQRLNDSIVIYKNKKTTGTNQYGVEAAVNSSGIVTEIYSFRGNTAVPSGGYVISGHGEGANWILRNLSVGDHITEEPAVKTVIKFNTPQTEIE